MAEFDGFPAEAQTLLGALPDFSREEYAARKKEIDAALFGPAKAYVEAMVPALQEVFGPGIDGSPKVNGSLAPLNNDLRFAPAGTPLYRDYLLVWFWDGPSKKTSPLLGMRLSPTDAGFGIGMQFDKAQLERWRSAIDDDDTGKPFAAAVADIVRRRKAEVVGQALKRVPKPFDPDHPRGDLLTHKGFQIRWSEPAKTLGSSRFVRWSVDRFAAAAPVHEFLRDHVA